MSDIKRSLRKFSAEMVLGHKLKVCTCSQTGCIYCDGGLQSCDRCGGGESDLEEACADRLVTQLKAANEQLEFARREIRDLRIVRDALAGKGAS